MIRVGVIGAGYIGPIHLGALVRIGGVKVQAVVDVYGVLAEKAAAAYNVEQYGTDYRDLVNDRHIDVIHNCTPNRYHYQITKDAIKAGKHVLSEKPLAMTLGQAEELVNLAEQKKAVVGINFCYRYYPVVQECMVRVRRGDAAVVRMVFGSYLQDWLSREVDWSWRLERSESGASNVTADLGSHWLDLIGFVTGLKVIEVIGNLETLIPKRRKPKRQAIAFEKIDEVESEEVAVEVEDYASIMFQLSNGAPGSFTTSQVCAGRKSDTELQIYGTDCSFAWNHKDATRLWIGYREKANEVLIENSTLQDISTSRYSTLPAGHPLGYHDAVHNLFRDYYEALEKNDNSEDSLRPNFRTGFEEMKIVEAILHSHEQKTWVRVEE